MLNVKIIKDVCKLDYLQTFCDTWRANLFFPLLVFVFLFVFFIVFVWSSIAVLQLLFVFVFLLRVLLVFTGAQSQKCQRSSTRGQLEDQDDPQHLIAVTSINSWTAVSYDNRRKKTSTIVLPNSSFFL